MSKNIKSEFYMFGDKRLITEFYNFDEECIERIRLNSSISDVFLFVDDLIFITRGIYLRVSKDFLKIWNKNIKGVKK